MRGLERFNVWVQSVCAIILSTLLGWMATVAAYIVLKPYNGVAYDDEPGRSALYQMFIMVVAPLLTFILVSWLAAFTLLRETYRWWPSVVLAATILFIEFAVVLGTITTWVLGGSGLLRTTLAQVFSAVLAMILGTVAVGLAMKRSDRIAASAA